MQATASAHPNVALIKYWGKQDVATNLPAVGSLSLTLGGLTTRTSVSFESDLEQDELVINGVPDAGALSRVTRCLDMLREHAGVKDFARVNTSNDFPTGAGLASSASGYAALVKAAAAALHIDIATEDLDYIARIGSGSAPRSLHAGIVLLEKTSGLTGTRCHSVAIPDDWPLSVVVAVTSRQPKDVSSTGGMESSRKTSSAYKGWVDTHPADLEAGLGFVRQRDFAALADISEHSCLKMHAVAMSSMPPLVYWSGATLACMQRIRELRKSGVPVFFTIDAGPQVKAVCMPEAVSKVHKALAEVPGVIDVLDCYLGNGAWVES
ncbi:MAG: diphosphomevalonate decarboxylase [Gammaproteobacteria bacterium]|nr:diphosphomevalonate decarboxylase [Gammaproteobacteria bacterium]MCP4091651.1 diphosphomevalonate decarboxylase [Gammaproteobacteria bacterium]MCP4276147.1 diphosphomevalonate decarboxylase [Gammaproteobacteria bacterium]MCP4831781.1 diphosphomevalonate decarboxylase [Gammaproteobacteria bacterium]MCP4929717.1 diphosphomevalonate decarboxylase [Gammaproteobacteria bacterium]